MADSMGREYPEDTSHKCPKCGNKARKNDPKLQDKFSFDCRCDTTVVECGKCGETWCDCATTIY